MKWLTFGIAWMILTILTNGTAYGQGYIWVNQTSADAISAVRAFEGNPVLNVTITSMPDGTPAASYLTRHDDYTLAAGVYQYRVCKYTLDFFSRRDLTFDDDSTFYGQPYDPNVLTLQAMSQANAQTIAQAFLSSHYPAPQLLQLLTVSSTYGAKINYNDADFIQTYEFRFDQDCGNGVLGPSSCLVKVDTILGKVVGYYSRRFPVLVSTTPVLSGNQAMAAVFTNLQVVGGQPLRIDGLAVSLPDAFGVEQLTYSLLFAGGVSGSSVMSEYSASVNATTGDVLGYSIINSMTLPKPSPQFDHFTVPQIPPKKQSRVQRLGAIKDHWKTQLTYPPLLIGGQPYLYIGYLGYGSVQTSLRYHAFNRKVILTTPDRQVIFQVASRRYTLHGELRRMAAPPILVNNRCYVPLEVAEGLMPFSLHYEVKTAVVRFESLHGIISATNSPANGKQATP